MNIKRELTVVIVAYKNIKLLDDCMNSIFKFNDIGEKLEVIIVDNSESQDLFVFFEEKYKDFEQVKVIKNVNNGFGSGNNLGVKNSLGEYLMFLNPDTVLIEPIFKDILEKFSKYRDIGIFGYRLLNRNLDRNYSFGALDKYGFINWAFFKFRHKYELFDSANMFIVGAAMVMQRKVFELAGCFDENMFMYMEEADLTKRVKKLGLKIYYFSDKSIVHLEGQMSTDSIKMYSIWLNSFKYYCSKYDLSYEKLITLEKRSNTNKLLLSKILGLKEKQKYYGGVLDLINKSLTIKCGEE